MVSARARTIAILIAGEAGALQILNSQAFVRYGPTNATPIDVAHGHRWRPTHRNLCSIFSI